MQCACLSCENRVVTFVYLMQVAPSTPQQQHSSARDGKNVLAGKILASLEDYLTKYNTSEPVRKVAEAFGECSGSTDAEKFDSFLKDVGTAFFQAA